MTVEIRIANNTDAQEWDKIIAESPNGTLFHHWNWLKITEEHTKSTLFPIIGIKNGVPVGVFPLFFQKKGTVRMVFSPPPRTSLPYLGPVFVEYYSLIQEKWETLYFDFLNSIENFINNDLKAQYTRISLPPSLEDPRPFTWSGYTVIPNYDYVTDLSIGPDRLLQTLDKNQRQNVNRAKKRGITVEIGGKKEYEMILDLMEIRYAKQSKILTSSRQYYLNIYDFYKDNLNIFVAKADGEVITGNIYFHYRDTFFSWIGYPKPINHISPSPNNLLIWEAVRYASEHGFKYFTTMGAAGNERLHSFYASKFNPELRIRYAATKNTYLAGIFEKGYLKILKPLRGRITRLDLSG